MARVQGALRAIATAAWRDVQSFRSITGQNLFFFVLLVAIEPESAELFAVLLGLVMLFPLSADPMERVPAERWHLWPLTAAERLLVRTASLFFTPIFWIALLLLLRGSLHTTLQFLAFVILGRLAYFALRSRIGPGANLLRYLPKPPGAIGAIMQLHWREMLATLDPYVALLLAILTVAYRPRDSNVAPIMSLVTVIAMSTGAQVVLGLDRSGIERWRLVPLRGWQLLLAKDLAWLVVVAILTAPLDLVSGLFAALAALTVGHYRSVLQPIPQARWRFTSGVLFPDGLLQIIALIAVGVNLRLAGPKLALAVIAVWSASIFYFGRQWDSPQSRP